METDPFKPFVKRAASWSLEHSQMLVNLWCEASKTVDFSKSTRNDHLYQQISQKLAAVQIFRTSDQCRERIKRLKREYRKTRDKNRSSGNSPMTCPFYEDFDRVLSSVPSLEPTALHDDLVSREGALLAPESSLGTDCRQQRAPSQDHEVTFLMQPVPEQKVDQDPQQMLSPCSEELFDPPASGKQPSENPVETEAALEPAGPSSYTACCSSGTPSLAQRTLTDRSKRKRFRDEVMVHVLQRVEQQMQYQKQRDERLEQRRAERQVERLRLAIQLEASVSAREQALAKQFLEQERQLREEDRAQQRELFQQLLSIMAARAQAPATSPTPRHDAPSTYPQPSSRWGLSLAGTSPLGQLPALLTSTPEPGTPGDGVKPQ